MLIGSPNEITYQNMILSTTTTILSVTSELPNDFNPNEPQSMNGILNNETGVSEVFNVSNTFRRTSEVSYEDEVVYLHMTPSANQTLSCMGRPSRSIIRRVSLREPYPMTTHDHASGQEFDFLDVSGMQLRRIRFQLTFADGTTVPPRSHISLSLLFAVVE